MDVREPLRDREQTGRRMYQLVRDYAGDLRGAFIRQGNKVRPLSSLSLPEMHDLVRKLPYKRDDEPVEVVGRPARILKLPALDCKKKGVLLGAWFTLHGYSPLRQWRFVASSRRPDGKIHHVFPQVKRAGTWRNVDATYESDRLFAPKTVTAMEVLEP
jgi:hypothetical protein